MLDNLYAYLGTGLRHDPPTLVNTCRGALGAAHGDGATPGDGTARDASACGPPDA